MFKTIKIPVLGPTTKLTSRAASEEVLLTGDEAYPVQGEIVNDSLVSVLTNKIPEILSEIRGLHRYWDCLPKTKKAAKILGFGEVWVGSLLVVSGDYKSEYGYLFNPPYEFHSWLSLDDSGTILDVALPGVIEMGLITSDEVGPYLVDREPYILAGKPPLWCKYVPVEVVT